MPAPLGLLFAAGAALLVLGSEKKKPAASTPTPTPSTPKPSTTNLPAGCELDAGLPPSWKDMVISLATANVTSDKALAWADGLDQAADKLAASGYPKAAACLKLRAGELRKMVPQEPSAPAVPAAAPPVPPSPPAVPASGQITPAPGNLAVNPLAQQDANMPFTVRVGDRPFGLALYYTGNGARFTELAATSPNLGPLATVNGVTNYQNWAPGLMIVIPAAWHPAQKPVPPTGL